MDRIGILLDKHSKTKLYIDRENASEILPYLHRDAVLEEFKDIRGILKENLRNRSKYCKVQVSNKAKGVYEMRFTRNKRNDRIYCKEIHLGRIRRIVLVELFEGKKSQQIPKKIKGRIEKIGNYEYEFEE